MSRTLRRFMPIAALCLATLVGGCVVVPEGPGYYGHGYGHGYYGHGWGWHR